MSFTSWLGFFVASILIAVTPGPGAVVSMSTGMRHGYRSALTAILGLQTAILIHLIIVALGLGALIAASEVAFDTVKFLGAAYLAWLGWQKWRSEPVVDSQDGALCHRGHYLQGIMVNLTNPKAIVFIGALVPQFVDLRLPQLPQYAIIAATVCLTDIVVMSGYALAASRVGNWLRDPAKLRWQNRAFGSLFLVAGTLLAFSSRPR